MGHFETRANMGEHACHCFIGGARANFSDHSLTGHEQNDRSTSRR